MVILCILVVGFSVVLVVLMSIVIFHYLVENYMWVKREWRLLDALSKDFQIAFRSMNQIEQRANQVLESELNLRGITIKLSEMEARWIKKAWKVETDAKRYAEELDQRLMMERRDIGVIKRYVLVLKMFIPIIKLAYRIRRTKKEIKKLAKNKKYTNYLMGLLEDSRTKVRRLQDRPIEETAEQIRVPPVLSFRSEVASLLERLINENPNLVRGMVEQTRSVVMHLQLLEPFINDLQGLWLESKIEEVWLDEAQKIIDHAQNDTNAFDTLLQEPENQMISGDWFLRRKFMQSIENFGSELSHLLEMKERYDFNFVRRVSSRGHAIFPHLQQHSSVMGEISGQLLLDDHNKIPSKKGPDKRVASLCRELEDAKKQLEDQYATEGATTTSMAGFELLEKMFEKTKKLLEDEEALGASGTRIANFQRYLKKMAHINAVSSRKKQTKNLRKDVGLLKRYAQVYRIKIKKESYSVVGLEEDIHELVLKLTTVVEHGSIISVVGMRGVVLDDLSSKEAWDLLKPAFAFDAMKDGSMVVLTTRNKGVALHANPSSTSIHPLRLRNREESWEIFTQMVQIPPDNEAMKSLAKKVVARTGGLPLAISRLGRLFSGKEVTNKELSRALELVSQGQNQTPWLEVIDLNRDQDLQLQPTLVDKCFSYFELFPRDFEIPARRLVALWDAQEVTIQSENANNKSNTEEQGAYQLLSELIDCNMIQVVERKRNGKVKTCRFPSILGELWLQCRNNSMNGRSWSLYAGCHQQISCRFDDNDASANYNGGKIHGLLDSSNLVSQRDWYPLSVMFFDTREGPEPGKDVGDFLLMGIKSGRFQELLVLDLERILRPNLIDTVGRLKKLTYLGLRRTELDTLPSSIDKLLHLQTLDLKHTAIRTLPKSIWKMKKLRHLYLNQKCRIKFMPQRSKISMENLETLSGAYVDHDGIALMNGLHGLSKLRKLHLTLQLTSPQQKVLATCIQQLTGLQSLSLRSVNENSEPQDLELRDCLGKLDKLSSLYLFGKLELTSLCELPDSLTELTVSASRLSGSVSSLLGKLGALPQLKFLSFLADSYSEPEMVFPEGFSKLRVLRLWNLDKLRHLEIQAMKRLRELEIRSCRNLERHTTGLTHLERESMN
ncbi:NB-ARC domain containing protein [Trema orientale]|uniref:NB-ARC domain containing protein n=1 Tax=Trema orientale TaxID=63057 RepID=A0A2P5ETP0_TREOI|nr:NB-ARC domain containing protein [Trema orientale]